MSTLPKEIKLTFHAQQRLEERRHQNNIYNTKNLMRSSCKWYNKGDIIPDSAFYRHCLYTTRKSKQFGYLTDGNIEVVYNKNTGVAVTVIEIKEKFKPITQYIKSDVLNNDKRKKENRKMKKLNIGTCTDCERENVELTKQGICLKCRLRKYNAKSHGKEYIPYRNLSEKEKGRVIKIQTTNTEKRKKEELNVDEEPKAKEELREIPMPNIAIPENFYQVKAENNPAIAQIPEKTNTVDQLSNITEFITTLRECGCEIPEANLAEVLKVLVATDKLRDIFMTIVKNSSQNAMLDLEQALNVGERKLQHTWEYNGFKEEDDVKFKNFLTWRRTLKGAIYFWKKLYQSNALIELQKAWLSYTSDPSEKTTLASDKERLESKVKRYQITTESVSTILNTRRPFTRVFYATSEEEAHATFVKWLADRQLHEDSTKTTITELTNEGVRELLG